MKRDRAFLFILFLITLSLCLVFACQQTTEVEEEDEDDDDSTASYTYAGTQAPGDYWEWTIDTDANGNGTFSAINYGTTCGVTASTTYSGTVTKLVSKFSKFTVTSTTNTSLSLDSTDAICYGVVIPGTTVLVQTAGAEKQFISCTLLSAQLPNANTTYNWVRIPSETNIANGDDMDTMSYGTSSITSVSGSSFAMTVSTYDFEDDLLSSQDMTAEISNYKIYTPTVASPQSISILTPSGCFVSDMGTDGGMFGTIAPSSNIDISTALSKEYRGFTVLYEGTDNTTIEPSYGALKTGSTDILRGGLYSNSDVEANALDESRYADVSFASASQNTPGIFTGITASNYSDSYSASHKMVINQIGGKYVIFGFSNQTTNIQHWFNFLMVEVD